MLQKIQIINLLRKNIRIDNKKIGEDRLSNKQYEAFKTLLLNTYQKGNSKQVEFEELMAGLKQELKEAFQLKEQTRVEK